MLPDLRDESKDYATCSLNVASMGAAGIKSESVRYIRIAQPLPWPYDNTHGGQRFAEKAHPNNWNPNRVIGTVPVEADGSAHFKVPVDMAVYFQLLDERGMELRRMRSFISFQRGEVRACVGCHETRAIAPGAPSQSMALMREPSTPKPPPWGERPISFLRDIQPVLDRACVSCHRGMKPAGGADLSGGLTREHNVAFDTIIGRKLVAWSDPMDDAKITLPLAFGSHRSKMISVLDDPTHKPTVKLSKDEWERLVTWIDANAPYNDRFINKRSGKPIYDLANDRDLAGRITAVHQQRCANCHKAADVSNLAWIDLRTPADSLFLTAPLKRCTPRVYTDTRDADYQAVFELVRAAVQKAWAAPRRDVAALVGSF